MGPEINIDSILALEKQIEEGAEDVIRLKCARNSLLNISARVPPEILGHIFCWSVTIIEDFGGLRKGSYNFLLVCHHWFQVAFDTPGLWAFWGNSLKQWSQRYRRSGTAPLDLVLNGRGHMRDENAIPFDGPLRDALQDHAARDSIRSVHLRGSVWSTGPLRSIISSLTPEGEGIRCSSIESLRLEYTYLDVSNFLTRHRFPKLRTLRLLNARFSSWDDLKLQAASLTTLSLETTESLTTPQLFSTLASYPCLQNLSLYEATIPHDLDDGSTLRAPLRHLKKLHLLGHCRHIFQLLDRLECSDMLDSVDLRLYECVGRETVEFLEQYLQDRIRRDDRFQGRLGIYVSSVPDSISFGVNIVGKFDITTMLPGRGYPSVSFTAQYRDTPPRVVGEELCTKLIALTPRERVVEFVGELSPHTTRDLFVIMPNIENLSLKGSEVSGVFLHPDPLHTKLLPSLRRLRLHYSTSQNDDDWAPLIAYLTHQTSGGQAISLRIRGRRDPVPPEVTREIKGLVGEFDLD